MSLSQLRFALAAFFIAILPSSAHAGVEELNAKADALKTRVGEEHRRLASFVGRWERLLLECAPEASYQSDYYRMLRRAVPHISNEMVHQAFTAYAEGILRPLPADPCTEASVTEAGEMMTSALRMLNVTGEELAEVYKAQADAMSRRP